MKCPNCQAANDTTARFCAECGTPLPQPRPATRPRPAGRVSCPKCGTSNPPNSAFCENCGSRLDRQARTAQTQSRPPRAASSAPAAPATAARPAQGTQEQKQPTSGAWWLLPIFLTWVGGLIGFLVVREKDKGKATGLLILGFIMTVFWIILGIGASAASYFTNF